MTGIETGGPDGGPRDEQRELLLDLISNWSGMADEESAAETRTEIEATLDTTVIAWSGETTYDMSTGDGINFSISGPDVYIAFQAQNGSAGADVDGVSTSGWGHVHTIHRDPTDDYAGSVEQQAATGDMGAGGGAPATEAPHRPPTSRPITRRAGGRDLRIAAAGPSCICNMPERRSRWIGAGRNGCRGIFAPQYLGCCLGCRLHKRSSMKHIGDQIAARHDCISRPDSETYVLPLRSRCGPTYFDRIRARLDPKAEFRRGVAYSVGCSMGARWHGSRAGDKAVGSSMSAANLSRNVIERAARRLAYVLALDRT